MKTPNLKHYGIAAGLMLLLICIFLASGMKPGKKRAGNDLNNPIKTCRMVKAEEIRKAFARSGSKKIILNIYPVKLSNNPNAMDFDLMIFFQDGELGNKNISGKINSKLFQMQARQYVSLLKAKNIQANKIPLGYYIEVTPASIKNIYALDICILPKEAKMEYCMLPGDPDMQVQEPGDSTGKCPPDCCPIPIQPNAYDSSTGKCPPDCMPHPLLLEKTMKQVIADAYKESIYKKGKEE